MEKQTLMTTRFLLEGGFYVDAAAAGDTVEFWIGHREADVKELMCSASAQFMPPERWETLVAENAGEYAREFSEAWLEE